MQSLQSKIMPFLLAGIAIVTFAFGIMLLFYLVLFGAATGLVLFAFSWLRNKFFPTKKTAVRVNRPGKIIDSSEWREL